MKLFHLVIKNTEFWLRKQYLYGCTEMIPLDNFIARQLSVFYIVI